jgi:hypothetical protein
MTMQFFVKAAEHYPQELCRISVLPHRSCAVADDC